MSPFRAQAEALLSELNEIEARGRGWSDRAPSLRERREAKLEAIERGLALVLPAPSPGQPLPKAVLEPRICPEHNSSQCTHPLRYWRYGLGERLHCRHGIILYGTLCVDCERDQPELAEAAADAVLGSRGPGPFPPSSGLTRGGRAEAMPVCHSEEADIDAQAVAALYLGAPTLRDRARELAGQMACNCDLDNWEPEGATGHSHVCRIHKAAVAQAAQASGEMSHG